jgi:hypothetical protein
MTDERLWQRLREETPEQFCLRTGAEFEPSTGRYRLPVLNGTLVLDAAEQHLEWISWEADKPIEFPDLTVQATAVSFLLGAQDLPFSGKWISPLELPSGEMFLRGPHGLPTAMLEAAFGETPEAFQRAAEAIGGAPLTFADVSYEFRVLPRVKLAVLLWRGDDEFPARVRFLVDDTIDQHLAIDAVLAVTHIVTDRLIGSE